MSEPYLHGVARRFKALVTHRYDPRLLEQEIAAEHRPAVLPAQDRLRVRGPWENRFAHTVCQCRHRKYLHIVACNVVGCACEAYTALQCPLVRVIGMGWRTEGGEFVAVSNGLESWDRLIGPFLCEYAPA